jgi:hypothetical protein
METILFVLCIMVFIMIGVCILLLNTIIHIKQSIDNLLDCFIDVNMDVLLRKEDEND